MPLQHRQRLPQRTAPCVRDVEERTVAVEYRAAAAATAVTAASILVPAAAVVVSVATRGSGRGRRGRVCGQCLCVAALPSSWTDDAVDHLATRGWADGRMCGGGCVGCTGVVARHVEKRACGAVHGGACACMPAPIACN
eukprot:293489-Chlamydomonas_euryale.AAC.1